MGKMKGLKILGLVAVAGFSISMVSCVDTSKSGNSKANAGATGNITVTNSYLLAVGIANALLSNSTGLPKPVASGVSAQSTLRDKNCGSGGTVVFDPENPTDTYTATMVNCTDENNVVINGTATGTVGPTTECTHNDIVEELPTSMDGVFNGTVSVDGQVFTFDNLGADITNIVYDPGRCNLDNGSFSTHLTGMISTTVGGENLSLDFGSNSIDVDTTITDPTPGVVGGRVVTTSVNGNATIDTFCKHGSMTISTETPLESDEGNVCPVAGKINVTGDFGKATIEYTGDCSDLVAFCELDLPSNPFSE
jgi:hypothetical protein